jgi:hypothetical protein
MVCTFQEDNLHVGCGILVVVDMFDFWASSMHETQGTRSKIFQKTSYSLVAYWSKTSIRWYLLMEAADKIGARIADCGLWQCVLPAGVGMAHSLTRRLLLLLDQNSTD